MEGSEQTVMQSGLLWDTVPAWLVFMLVGVIAALVLIGVIKRKGVPFLGIIIVVIIVILLFTNGGNINWKEWRDKLFNQNAVTTEEPAATGEPTEPPEGAEDEITTSEDTWIQIALKNLFNKD